MSLDDQTEKAKNDWSKLATDALDLWQNHLTSLANDPKAKEEMAQLVAPMGKMFSDWTEMVQQGIPGMEGMMPKAPEEAKVDPATAENAAQHNAPAQAPEPQAVTPEPAPIPEPAPEEIASVEPVSPVTQAAPAESGIETVIHTTAQPVAPQADMAPAATTKPLVTDPTVKDTSHEPESSASAAQPQSAAAPAAVNEPTDASGGTVSATGHRNLVELADRLAFLERELEELRTKRQDDDNGDSLSGTDQDVQQVVGSDTGTASS